MSTPYTEESAWRIAARVLGSAPRFVKLLTALAVAYLAVMTAWMVLGMGVAAVGPARLWGGLSGAVSAILLSWTYGLFEAAQGSWSTRWQFRLRPQRLHQMLLALPIMAFTAGIFGAISVAMIAPLIPGSPIYLFGALPPAAIVVFAARAVGDATRFLYRHAQEQAEAAARARAEAADAQLAALQAQMNPHFLFNALNTIASLVRTDPRAAEATTENLAQILRRTLDRSRHTQIPLRDEIDFVRAYLAIEAERFGSRLAVEWSIPAETLDVKVPPMTLQPLVENALKHGIGARLEGGRVTIGAARLEGTLRLEVADDGAGFARQTQQGTGLGNLRRRLATLHGEDAALRIEKLPTGARVVVEIPLNGRR